MRSFIFSDSAEALVFFFGGAAGRNAVGVVT